MHGSLNGQIIYKWGIFQQAMFDYQRVSMHTREELGTCICACVKKNNQIHIKCVCNVYIYNYMCVCLSLSVHACSCTHRFFRSKGYCCHWGPGFPDADWLARGSGWWHPSDIPGRRPLRTPARRLWLEPAEPQSAPPGEHRAAGEVERSSMKALKFVRLHQAESLK